MHFGYLSIMFLSVRTDLMGHSTLQLEAVACHMELTQKTAFQFWVHVKFQPQFLKGRSWLRGLSEIITLFINLQPGDKARY